MMNREAGKISRLYGAELDQTVSEYYKKCADSGEQDEVCLAKSDMAGQIAEAAVSMAKQSDAIKINLAAAECTDKFRIISAGERQYASAGDFCKTVRDSIDQCTKKLPGGFDIWCKTEGELFSNYAAAIYSAKQAQQQNKYAVAQKCSNADDGAQDRIVKNAAVAGICAAALGAAAFGIYAGTAKLYRAVIGARLKRCNSTENEKRTADIGQISSGSARDGAEQLSAAELSATVNNQNAAKKLKKSEFEKRKAIAAELI